MMELDFELDWTGLWTSKNHEIIKIIFFNNKILQFVSDTLSVKLGVICTRTVVDYLQFLSSNRKTGTKAAYYLPSSSESL